MRAGSEALGKSTRSPQVRPPSAEKSPYPLMCSGRGSSHPFHTSHARNQRPSPSSRMEDGVSIIGPEVENLGSRPATTAVGGPKQHRLGRPGAARFRVEPEQVLVVG